MAAGALCLLSWGLVQTFYLGTVTDAFARDRTGNILILVGAVLNLAATGSLLPHIGALAAVPMGLAGTVGGAAIRTRRTRS